MSIDQIRTELATLLRTTPARLERRVAGLKIGPTCQRCGGSGAHSFNQFHGSMCYGCSGAGTVRPSSLSEWQDVLTKARAAQEDGTLDRYMEFLAAKPVLKTALDEVMVAWSASGVSSKYDWRKSAAGHEPDLSISTLFNKPMCAAYEAVTQARNYAHGKLGPDLHEAILRLRETRDEALRTIREKAEEMNRWLEEYAQAQTREVVDFSNVPATSADIAVARTRMTHAKNAGHSSGCSVAWGSGECSCPGRLGVTGDAARAADLDEREAQTWQDLVSIDPNARSWAELARYTPRYSVPTSSASSRRRGI